MSRTRDEIQKLGDDVEVTLKRALDDASPLVIVKAPPGSGKTYLLLKGVEHAAIAGGRVAIGGQTNSQINDI